MERLIWSESIIEEARSARAQVALDLRRAGVAGEVLVTGPASTPGVLTKGDLDLHLRVAAGQFAGVTDRLGARPSLQLSVGAAACGSRPAGAIQHYEARSFRQRLLRGTQGSLLFR